MPIEPQTTNLINYSFEIIRENYRNEAKQGFNIVSLIILFT